MRDAIENAIAAASGVHQVRDTAEAIDVYAAGGMTSLGAYAHEQGGRPVAIFVNRQTPDAGLTVLHEVGHYLDQHAMLSAGYASASEKLNEWRARVLNSAGVRDLIAAWVNPPEPRDQTDAAVVAATVRATSSTSSAPGSCSRERTASTSRCGAATLTFSGS